MSLMTPDLARAEAVRRLDEAQRLRRGHTVARARRLRGRADRAARQARLAVARVL